MARAKQSLTKKYATVMHPAALPMPVKKEAPTRKTVLKMVLDRHPASCRAPSATKH